MPLTDPKRLAAERLTPQILQLWRALVPLTSVISFMSTGAHPDDEKSDMLAALSFRDGFDLSYACSTRGEGGQNDIGTETSEALGALRTAEMERACDILNMRMYWHCEYPQDTIFDFGFSKSGDETLAKWGHQRLLKRFVEIIRTERPDIICPTFLDVPGQHGHHRAMTQAAFEVMSLAADPTYLDSDLPVWQVKKLYLPAYSGAGQAYDDDLPPPPVTLTVQAKGVEQHTGWSYARIGQQSRAFHLTQAMGRWVAAGDEKDWPLHLAQSHVDGPDTDLHSGLAATLADMDVPSLNRYLRQAQDNVDAAIAAFPDGSKILPQACSALRHIREAIQNCPESSRGDVLHKLSRKEAQLSNLIAIAAGVQIHTRLDRTYINAGDAVELVSELRPGRADSATLKPALPPGWSQDQNGLCTALDVQVSDSYPSVYLPDTPRLPCIEASLMVHGEQITRRVAFETPPVVLPCYSATVSPDADVINSAMVDRVLTITVKDIVPSTATASLSLPDRWQATRTETGFSVTAPEDVAPGSYSLGLLLDGRPAQQIHKIEYAHIDPRAIIRPAEIKIQVVHAALPDVRIGYIGGGNDRVDHWLDRLGADVVALSDDDLKSEAVLAEFDTLVIGIFAFKFRDCLSVQMPRLHRWCEQGGTLLTLYHRPWDNWDPDYSSPRMLEIGQPSLRWRVTDETANVEVLHPNSPLMTHPNQITAADWDNWHKERGLYFAKRWDPAYLAILSMADPQEHPLEGALLCADIGKGRHIHTSLILHHQMEKTIPGAFRIMANLLAKREAN
ncbi:PIG-L family deacetylase (plasmid) [Parasedimentitalea marina]|uniref:PIG-L family deacetylase n=1 Tax=Parasedimentitalea marina TaxID=2483033 RepID=A0A3T0NAP6_9RHOB|nr:PIG-L family deacetylase [Parasedimentitalea marina]AZV81035.1 PIG-L family deacetylase [Parasedimentitalea marina]